MIPDNYVNKYQLSIMKTIVLFAVSVSLIACFSKKPEKNALEGTSLPAFSLLLPDSATWFNTGNIPVGKPSVLFQFSPHCPYCTKQMKDIIRKMDQLKDINFYLITLFPFKDMKAWHEEFQLAKYPNIIIGQDTAGFAAEYFEAAVVPHIAIYDRSKKFSKSFAGQLSPKEILATIYKD
jgi:thioredoxin-related protein